MVFLILPTPPLLPVLPIAPGSRCPLVERWLCNSRSSSARVVFEAAPHIVARLPHADLWMAFLRDQDDHLLTIMREAPRG